MKNFALVISSAALTGVVVWIIMGGLNADPQGSKDNHVVPSEKASVSEVEFRKEMADVKKAWGIWHAGFRTSRKTTRHCGRQKAKWQTGRTAGDVQTFEAIT